MAGRDFRRDAVLLAAEVERRSLRGEAPLHVVSLDASKAFPSSSRTRMWSVLQNEGLPRKLTNLFEWAYVNGDAVIRLCGRFAGSQHFALKRGIYQGCPFSVMSFLGLQLPALRLVARECVGVRMLVYADDVTIFGESKTEVQRAANLLHQYYANGDIAINAAKTQYLVSSGVEESIMLADQKVSSSDHIKILGIMIRNMKAVDSEEKTRDTLTKMAACAIRMEGLPANSKAKEAAWAGIIAAGLWWCPWTTLLKGSRLTQARMLLLRAIKPGLHKGPRLAGVATCFLMKGHRVDPIMVATWEVVRWMQLLPGDLQAWVDQIPESEHTPIGPVSCFRYYCGQLNLRVSGGWASIGGCHHVELRCPVGHKARWEHQWRHLIRSSLARLWAYRREFNDWAEHEIDFERSLTYYRRQDDPQLRNALEILFTGGMLTNARLHRADGGFRGCTCGAELDTDIHRFWECNHTYRWRQQLGIQRDQLPAVTQQAGWILTDCTLSSLHIRMLHEYMAKVVRFFWNLGKGGDDFGDHGGGGDGDEASAVRGIGVAGLGGPALGGEPSLAETHADRGSRGPGQTGMDDGKKKNQTRRGNCRTVSLPGHVVLEDKKFGASSEVIRLTCTNCGARGSDKNRTRFVRMHAECTPDKPLATRKKRCLTRGERAELQEATGVEWQHATQRAKRHMVDAFER